MSVKLVLCDVPMQTKSGMWTTCPARVPIKLATMIALGKEVDRMWAAKMVLRWQKMQRKKRIRIAVEEASRRVAQA